MGRVPRLPAVGPVCLQTQADSWQGLLVAAPQFPAQTQGTGGAGDRGCGPGRNSSSYFLPLILGSSRFSGDEVPPEAIPAAHLALEALASLQPSLLPSSYGSHSCPLCPPQLPPALFPVTHPQEAAGFARTPERGPHPGTPYAVGALHRPPAPGEDCDGPLVKGWTGGGACKQKPLGPSVSLCRHRSLVRVHRLCHR